MAAEICSQAFTVDRRAQELQSIRHRLERYFGQDLRKATPLSDAEAAGSLLNKMEKKKSSLSDLKILSIIVSIFESTQGQYEVRVPGFYVDLYTGIRPKSNFFQERHWDWNILDGYFFNTPMSLSLTKQQDIEYLEHIFITAQGFGGKATLREVLQAANHTWTVLKLEKFPSLSREYENYLSGKSYEELYNELKNKFQLWIQQGKAYKQVRAEQVRSTLRAFRSSNSIFDLFILDKYFSLLVALKTREGEEPFHTLPTWLQLTDERVFEMGLPSGSIAYLTDFLFQNSHDVASKAYLQTILNEMRIGAPFPEQFLAAKARVDQALPVIQAPEVYATDLHIFSKRQEDSGYLSSSIDHTRVFWNFRLGRVQTNIVEAHPTELHFKSTVGSEPHLRDYIKMYFDQFRKNGTYSLKEVNRDEKAELQSKLKDSVFFVFTKPGTDQMLVMTRLFDGTATKTFIENEFPHVRLPGRDKGETILELGRLLAVDSVEAFSLEIIMARVAEYLSITQQQGRIYFDGNLVAMKRYRRLGAKVDFSPEDLRQKPEDTPLWIMSFSIDEFVQKFSKPVYQSVRVRSKAADIQHVNSAE